MATDPRGFGSPGDYSAAFRPPEHERHWCPWCGACLHCYGNDPCPNGTDGLHYWPARGGGS